VSPPAGPPRVGFLGRLGAGNLGNDASLEVVLGLVRARRPDAVLDAMCSGPEVVRERYDLPTVELHRALRGPTPWRVLAGLVVDAVRVGRWVRRHDVVLVPGMGTLESTLQERAWQMPWTLLVMAVSGRLWRTRVALVGVGAGAVPERAQRWMFVTAARLVAYRSFRDERSRDEMQRMGLRTHDGVLPDVVLALPVPPHPPARPRSVGLGVMAWSGSNGERALAERLHAAYVAEMERVLELLLERGYDVSVLVGDADDVPVAQDLVSGAGSERVRLVVPTTPDELVEAVSAVEVVVAARYHNVVGALRCATPVVALCYAPKHRDLMALMGVEGLCHELRGLDAERLVDHVDEVHRDREGVRAHLEQRLEELAPTFEQHFDEVAARLLDAPAEVPA
jgi:polysaccharide pyruvyl transferase WcaK-like protein